MEFWLVTDGINQFYVPFYTVSTVYETTEPTECSSEKEHSASEQKFLDQLPGNGLGLTRADLQMAPQQCNRNNWTQEEDKQLLKLAKLLDLDWNQISKKIPNRNPKMCYSRYRRLSYHTKKRWSPQQQETIIEGVEKGHTWKEICGGLEGRTPRQVQQHYEFCLKPGINRSLWTIEEDVQLIQLIEKYGTDWKEISANMKSRTQNQIKNRYFGRLLKIYEQKIKNGNIEIPKQKTVDL